jgi:hypothetical protein
MQGMNYPPAMAVKVILPEPKTIFEQCSQIFQNAAKNAHEIKTPRQCTNPNARS